MYHINFVLASLIGHSHFNNTSDTAHLRIIIMLVDTTHLCINVYVSRYCKVYIYSSAFDLSVGVCN